MRSEPSIVFGMEKRLGEKTSDLEPKSIDSSGVKRLKKLAKLKQKEQGCQLSDALELVAQEHGFKNWNNVHRFASKRPDSSRSISFEGFWSTNMFIELRSEKNTFVLSSVRGELTPITDDTRINLAQVVKIEFFTRYLVQERMLGGWCLNEKQRDLDIKGRSELEEFRNTSCRVVRIYSWRGEIEAVFDYLFFDEGEYHRVKRGIDDLTSGMSKK